MASDASGGVLPERCDQGFRSKQSIQCALISLPSDELCAPFVHPGPVQGDRLDLGGHSRVTDHKPRVAPVVNDRVTRTPDCGTTNNNGET